MGKTNKTIEKKEYSMIVELWAGIFGFLSKISIFALVRKSKRDISYTFVEKWVLGNLIGSFLATLLGYYWVGDSNWPIYILIGYGILRVFEVIVYQLNVVFFDPYRAEKEGKVYKIKSPTRMVILLLHNYLEVMLWYAAIIISLIQLSGGSIEATWGEFVRSNIVCVATFSSDAVQEAVGGAYPKVSSIVFVQVISGIIMTIISLARFIGIMPSVEYVDRH